MARQEFLDRFGTALLLLLVGAIISLLIYAFREEFDDRAASAPAQGAGSVSMRAGATGELGRQAEAAASRT